MESCLMSNKEPSQLKIPAIKPPLNQEIGGKEQDAFAERREIRNDKMHGLLHWLIMISIIVGYTLILCVGGVWLYHFLTPKNWYHWLDVEKLEAIRWFITGVFGSQLLTEFVKKKIQLDK